MEYPSLLSQMALSLNAAKDAIAFYLSLNIETFPE